MLRHFFVICVIIIGLTCCVECYGEKPGKCPALKPGTVGLCAEFCTGDYSCKGKLKCCSNGCGRSCQNPVIEKPGKCPAVKPGVGGACADLCSGDDSCKGKQKCCSNGCGRSCQKPVYDC